MLTLIIGKSSSGKSLYAEGILERISDVPAKYYIATMKVCDNESKARKERHMRQREGKGFVTIEQHVDLSKAINRIEAGSAVLLECMTNLTANEMFEGELFSKERVTSKIISEALALEKKAGRLIVVSGDVSEYDGQYDGETEEYIATLEAVNEILSGYADEVIEVAEGVPRVVKGQKE